MKVFFWIVLFIIVIGLIWYTISFIRDKKSETRVSWGDFIRRIVIDILVIIFCLYELFPNTFPL